MSETSLRQPIKAWLNKGRRTFQALTLSEKNTLFLNFLVGTGIALVLLFLVFVASSAPPGALERDPFLYLFAVVLGGFWTSVRMEWFGLRFQPRLWLWHTLLFLLWIGTGAIFFLLARFHFDQGDALHKAGSSPASEYLQAWIISLAEAALLSLGLFGKNVRKWAANTRRITGLIVALTTVAGLPLAWFVYTFAIEFAPPSPASAPLLLAAPLVLLPLAGGVTIFVLGLVIRFATFGFFYLRDLPLRVFDYLRARDEAQQIRSQKKQGLSDYFMQFDRWLRNDPAPEIPDDSKGSRFATAREAAAITSPSGSPYGYLGGQPFQFQTDKHVLVMASTRGGKGVSIIIPRLLTYFGSMFVLDPKGENARATGRFRGMVNNTVHYLDPFGISGKPKSRFNPLSRFTLENMEAESKALAGALILSEHDRDHWTGSAQQLLAAVILYVFTAPDILPDEKDLVHVRRLILGGIKPTLAAMAQSDAADGLLSGLAQSFIDTPEREFGSILSTAQRQTEILDNPFIAASLSARGEGQEVDFSGWHTGTMSVFLCLSAPKFPVFNRWLRLVLTAALDEMTDTLRPPALPVCFMLDELATLGHLSVVENAVGLAAGYGVQIVSVFQDVAQMRDLYKGRWASFVGNAGMRVLFNVADFETAEYWSKFIGGRTAETLNLSQDVYGITQGQSRGEAIRPLLTPDDLMLQFAGQKMLLLPEGTRPVVVDRVPYFVNHAFAGRWDDPRPAPGQPPGNARAWGGEPLPRAPRVFGPPPATG